MGVDPRAQLPGDLPQVAAVMLDNMRCFRANGALLVAGRGLAPFRVKVRQLLIQIDPLVEPVIDDGLAVRLSVGARAGVVDREERHRHADVERHADQATQQEAERGPSRKGQRLAVSAQAETAPAPPDRPPPRSDEQRAHDPPETRAGRAHASTPRVSSRNTSSRFCAAVRVAQLVQRAGGDETPAADDDNMRAEPRDVIHQMRREQHRRAVGRRLAHDVVEQMRRLRRRARWSVRRVSAAWVRAAAPAAARASSSCRAKIPRRNCPSRRASCNRSAKGSMRRIVAATSRPCIAALSCSVSRAVR